MQYISIAIDGPSGAGKSTISRAAAKRLGFLYVDTGAIYRSVGLYAMRAGVDKGDTNAICALLPDIHITIRHGERGQKMLLNGEDVTSSIREHAVSAWASAVSAVPQVRAFLLDMQRSFAREHNVIMDGRDIGTVVLPDAAVKIFLTASPEDRARRRYEELRQAGQDVDYATILKDVNERDLNDSMRAAAPLRPAGDAVIADTTGNTLDQSINLITSIIEERIARDRL